MAYQPAETLYGRTETVYEPAEAIYVVKMKTNTLVIVFPGVAERNGVLITGT